MLYLALTFDPLSENWFVSRYDSQEECKQHFANKTIFGDAICIYNIQNKKYEWISDYGKNIRIKLEHIVDSQVSGLLS